MKNNEMFETVRKCLGLYGVASAVVLSVVIANAATQGSVSTFMWVRSVLLLAVTPLLYRLAARDPQRLRTVATVLPIAIVVVDLIPGVCPVWFAALQAASALPLIAVAVMMRRRTVAETRTACDD
ncbi:hypothetical protein OG474_36480 [Kribbella sp. NBC_01505]|uniref:hypothetical protein n=1 Tax=Kribbella sp. NBC_01505 TaxID=2903580 RepID=UPI0038682D5A